MGPGETAGTRGVKRSAATGTNTMPSPFGPDWTQRPHVLREVLGLPFTLAADPTTRAPAVCHRCRFDARGVLRGQAASIGTVGRDPASVQVGPLQGKLQDGSKAEPEDCSPILGCRNFPVCHFTLPFQVDGCEVKGASAGLMIAALTSDDEG